VRRVVLSCIMLGAVACAGEVDDVATGHERVAPLDEAPLALVAQERTVLVALPAELAKVDDVATADGKRAVVRITDGRYRECPWDPWQRWDRIGGVAPRVTPDGGFLTMTTGLCGAWAWPFAGDGPARPLARANRDYTAQKTEAAPLWDAVGSIPVVRDGDGWIACGRQDHLGGIEIWSLADDGTPRGKIADAKEACDWIGVSGDAILVADRDTVRRLDRKTEQWTILAKAEPSYSRLTIAGETDSHLIVLRETAILRLPKDGGDAETIIEAPSAVGCSFSCFAAAVDDTHVYWTDGRSLSRTPHADLTRAEELVGAHDDRAFHVSSSYPSIAVTNESIWVTTMEGPSFREQRPWLSRVPKPPREGR
jgi:hypothetical protein